MQIETKITARMVSLVESEAARCRAQSFFMDSCLGPAKDFAKEWMEVAEALQVAAEALREIMVAQYARR